MKNFKIKSYCKINLSLKILKKLKDGFHNIISLITFCDLYDLISINKINGPKDKIIFSWIITQKSLSLSNIKFLLNIQTNTPDTKHIKQILVILI